MAARPAGTRRHPRNGRQPRIALTGFGDPGLACPVETGRDPRVHATVLVHSLGSFVSPGGFGELWHKWSDDPCGPVRNLAAFVPNLFWKVGDWPQLAAFVCPRPLLIANPERGDKKPMPADEAAATCTWTASIYALTRSADHLTVQAGMSPQEIAAWMSGVSGRCCLSVR